VAHLGTQLPPGGATQISVPERVGGFERAVDGILNRLVDDEPVRPRLDEREGTELTEKVIRVLVGEHRSQ